jgi:hypothetical protein
MAWITGHHAMMGSLFPCKCTKTADATSKPRALPSEAPHSSSAHASCKPVHPHGQPNQSINQCYTCSYTCNPWQCICWRTFSFLCNWTRRQAVLLRYWAAQESERYMRTNRSSQCRPGRHNRTTLDATRQQRKPSSHAIIQSTALALQ